MKGEALNILLVEDNDDHAELVLRNFAEHQVANKIVRVCDGESALDYLYRRKAYAGDERSPRAHLVLLDLRLPKIDGLEVLRRIKTDEVLKRIPVVILTTSAADSDVRHAQELYANAYVVKPVDFSKLTCLLRDLGFFWLAWNQPPSD